MKNKNNNEGLLLVKGGTLINPAGEHKGAQDVLIRDGKIDRIGKSLKDENAEVLDASSCWVCPGFLDMHVHLREPGCEYKETIASGTLAAARGGFTAVACMANTSPCVDNRSVVEFIQKKAKSDGAVKVYPVGAVSRQLEGKELSDIGEMKHAGIAALSDDGKGVQNSSLLRRAMEYAGMFNLPIISHAEDAELVSCGVMHEGFTSTRLGLRGIPSMAEVVGLSRDILLSEMTGCPVHIAHVSCKRSVELIRDAKKRGIKVTCEVTPHHLSLVDRMLDSYDTSLKVNPPLREPEDILELRRGLKDGTIDCIATDHAPHAVEEKEVEFDKAPFGLIGLETAVGVLMKYVMTPDWTRFFEPYVMMHEWKFSRDSEESELCLSPEEFVQKLCVHPRDVLHVGGNALSCGENADITIIDPEETWRVDVSSFASKSKNCPYHGWELKGKARAVVVDGVVVFHVQRNFVKS